METYLFLVWIRYHVPRSWFKASGNILVIFEEKGGDPSEIRFSIRKTSGFCALVAEDHPSFAPESLHEGGIQHYKNSASVQLKCPINTRISTVKFASFGTPSGTCGSYTMGDCHDPRSISAVEKVTTCWLCHSALASFRIYLDQGFGEGE